jgi:hypothetical protein
MLYVSFSAIGKASAKSKHSAREGEHSSEPKRRPGRPRGSKNRKPRVTGESTIKPQSQSSPSFYSYTQPLHPTGTGTAPPALPEVNAQNQQYYELQWRVLNLCAEFYGAAEELLVREFFWPSFFAFHVEKRYRRQPLRW